MKQINSFLDRFETSKLSDKQIELCENEITESDIYSAIKNMENNKSTFKDGLTKKFNEIFWDEIIDLFCKSIKHTKTEKGLRVSQN